MEKRKSKTREWTEALIIAAAIALFVRSFIIQAYKIPSGSMEPTLLVGDYLFVNRLHYVVKIPVVDTVLYTLGKPKRGDIVVFRYPQNTSMDYIKRVIATEGDTIEIKDKIIYINGKKIEDPWGHYRDTAVIPGILSQKDNMKPFTVPKDAYFVMGDNRDNSQDSRFWGVVRKEHLVGKALILYFSWDSNPEKNFQYIRWPRIGWLIR